MKEFPLAKRGKPPHARTPLCLYLLTGFISLFLGCTNEAPFHVGVNLLLREFGPTDAEIAFGIGEVVIDSPEKERAVETLFAELATIYRGLDERKTIRLKSVDYFSDEGSRYIRASFATQNLVHLFAKPVDLGYLSFLRDDKIRLRFSIPHEAKETRTTSQFGMLTELVKKLGWRSGLEFKITFPWKVMEANGRILEPKNVVVWKFGGDSFQQRSIQTSMELTWYNWFVIHASWFYHTYLAQNQFDFISQLPRDCSLEDGEQIANLPDDLAKTEFRNRLRINAIQLNDQWKQEDSLLHLVLQISEAFNKAYDQLKGINVLDPLRSGLFWAYIRATDVLWKEGGFFPNCHKSLEVLNHWAKRRLGEKWLNAARKEIGAEMDIRYGASDDKPGDRRSQK